MREWNRTSEEISLANLPPDCREALEAHIAAHHLELQLENPVSCLKTVSHSVKKRLFSGGIPKQTESFILLFPQWLIWTVSADGGPPTALSARRSDIHFENYTESPSFRMIQDGGLTVTGKLTGRIGMQGQEQMTVFIGLGDQPAAEKFMDALRH
jgi:hypothetical protein